MKRIALLSFFLTLIFVSCTHKNSIPGYISDKGFIDAVLVKDTALLNNLLDTLSLKMLHIYKTPTFSGTDNLHYRLVVTRRGRLVQGEIYQYTILFPWKESFSFYIVKGEKKWSILPVSFIRESFNFISKKGIYYFYPEHESVSFASEQVKKLAGLKGIFCRGKSLCPHGPIYYFYTGGINPDYVYRLNREHKIIYQRGVCISDNPVDTLGLLHTLLDYNDYLFPFVRGVYYKYMVRHKIFGHDLGDWLRSDISSGSFRLLGKSMVENMVFYRPLAIPLGYVFVSYLSDMEDFNTKMIIDSVFSLNAEEQKIVKNNGDREVFIRRHVEKILKKSYDSIIPEIGKFILYRYGNISNVKDTIRIVRDKRRNLTFVISSFYKDANKIEHDFKLWLDSIPFFYRGYYTILLVPIWEADSFKRLLTPVNSYWVAAYEFKSKEEILKELKDEYATFLVSDFIRKYSLQEKQLPLWVSLGLPKYFVCRDTCNLNMGEVLKLQRGDAYAFYQNPMKGVLPQQAITLSYLMVRLLSRIKPGIIPPLLEKSMANMSFSATYKEVTNSSIDGVFRLWKAYIDDTLYYRVSRK